MFASTPDQERLAGVERRLKLLNKQTSEMAQERVKLWNENVKLREALAKKSAQLATQLAASSGSYDPTEAEIDLREHLLAILDAPSSDAAKVDEFRRALGLPELPRPSLTASDVNRIVNPSISPVVGISAHIHPEVPVEEETSIVEAPGEEGIGVEGEIYFKKFVIGGRYKNSRRGKAEFFTFMRAEGNYGVVVWEGTSDEVFVSEKTLRWAVKA